MEVDGDLVGAEAFDGFAEVDVAAVDRHTGCLLDFLGQRVRREAPEEAAAFPGFRRDAYRRCGQALRGRVRFLERLADTLLVRLP